MSLGHRILLAAGLAERSVKISLTSGDTIEVPAPEVELTTVEGIELVSVGMDWPGLGKPTTITEENVKDAAEAANHKLFTNPRFGLGHEEDLGDREPAFGTYTNVRVSDNGQTLLGDLTAVPVWVAKMLPAAYPGRSIEGRYNQKLADGSRNYSLVIDAVKMLGVRLPACKAIADLPAQLATWYGGEPPEGVTVDGIALAGTQKLGEVDADTVKRAFYGEFCRGQYLDWWCRSLRVDDSGAIRIISEAPDGELYGVPVTVGGDGAITFGDPGAVVEEFVAASEAPQRERIALAYATRDESRADLSQEGQMDPKELRKRLGLAEDASDADLNARVDALSAVADKKADDPPPDPKPDDDPKPAEPAPTLAATPGTVVVDKAAYDLMMSTANTVQAIQKREREQERDTEINLAASAGKFPPARKAHWSTLWDNDPEGTKAALAALAPGLVPVGPELGTGGPGDDDVSNYDRSMLTVHERTRLAQADKRAAGELAAAGVTFSSSEG